MTISIIFKPSTAGPATELTVGKGHGFVMGGPLCFDVFAFYDGNTGLSLVLCNGLVDGGDPSKQRGPLTGEVLVAYAGETRLGLTPVTINDACGKVLRFGTAKRPDLSMPIDWSTWWLRHYAANNDGMDRLREAVAAADFTIDESKAMNPEQSGSARVAQSIHRLTLATLLGIRADEALASAIAFTDFQIEKRHAIFYDATGKLLRADEAPYFRQGPLGWSGKIKRPCGTKWQFDSEQHPAYDPIHLLATAYGDGPAGLMADAYTECFLSYPEYAGALADDPRSTGYCLRLSALDILRKPGRQHVQDALVRCVSGLRNAMGFAFNGDPYPCRNPPKTGKWPYGYPSRQAWDRYAKLNAITLPSDVKPPEPGETCDHLRVHLVAEAKRRKLAASRFTDGHGGLWDYFRGVPIFQCAVLLQGLCTVRDVPEAAALVPDIDALIGHVRDCILGPGSTSGMAPDGSRVEANPVVYAYAALAPQYVMPWTAGKGEPVTGRVKNGALTWLCNSLLLAGGQASHSLAESIWDFTDYPEVRDPEVFGILGYREFA